MQLVGYPTPESLIFPHALTPALFIVLQAFQVPGTVMIILVHDCFLPHHTKIPGFFSVMNLGFGGCARLGYRGDLCVGFWISRVGYWRWWY